MGAVRCLTECLNPQTFNLPFPSEAQLRRGVLAAQGKIELSVGETILHDAAATDLLRSSILTSSATTAAPIGAFDFADLDL